MKTTLTRKRAAAFYAWALNAYDVSPLEDLLADHFHYASQWVFEEITSKADYLRYLRGKFHTLRDGRDPVFAELAHVDAYGEDQPCVVLAQGSRTDLVAIALFQVAGDRITRIDLCAVPPPESARRSGIYPGLKSRNRPPEDKDMF